MRFPVNKLHQILYVELLSETVEFMTHHFWVHSAPWQNAFNTQQECNSQDQFNRCSHSLTLELSKKRQVVCSLKSVVVVSQGPTSQIRSNDNSFSRWKKTRQNSYTMTFCTVIILTSFNQTNWSLGKMTPATLSATSQKWPRYTKRSCANCTDGTTNLGHVHWKRKRNALGIATPGW